MPTVLFRAARADRGVKQVGHRTTTGMQSVQFIREKSMASEEKILQIMPADEWFDDDESLDAVVCFALVESVVDGVVTRTVRPMAWNGSAIGFADEDESFEGVIRSDEITDDDDEDFDEDEDA